MIRPKVITAPTLKPVTVTEVKQHLRITHTSEDTLLDLFISAATSHFEKNTGRTVYETTLEIAMQDFPYSERTGYYGGQNWDWNIVSDFIELPNAAPLISVVSVKYLDKDGVSTTWPSTSYVVDTHEDIGRIAPAYGVTYPSFIPYPLNAVRIRYIAGIENVTSPLVVPEEGIRVCIMQIAGSMYLFREQFSLPDFSGIDFVLNPVTRVLLDRYRVKYAF